MDRGRVQGTVSLKLKLSTNCVIKVMDVFALIIVCTLSNQRWNYSKIYRPLSNGRKRSFIQFNREQKTVR